MPSLTRSLAAPAASLAMLATLGLGGIAYAAEDAEQPSQDCLAKRQNLAVLQSDLQAALDLGTDTPGLHTQVEVALDLVADACPADVEPEPEPEPTDEPPATDDPPVTDEPDPTEQPTTPPATEPPFVDRDCADLAPGEADEILAADPSDPHRLDRDNDGVPCEIEDLADEGANPDGGDGDDSPTVISGGPTAGSGSNSQFEAMPSTAPETGRA